MKNWNLTQRLCLILSVLFLAHAIGGMIVNPDFGVGDQARSESWLWMDWNGWHALSGILMWTIGIAVASRASIARLFALGVIAANLPIVLWMVFDSRPLGLFVLPTTGDLVFHAAIVAIFASAVVVDRTRVPALTAP